MSSFEKSLRNRRANLRDFRECIQNGFVAFLTQIGEVSIGSRDVAKAAKTAIGLIPTVGSYMTAAIDITEALSGGSAGGGGGATNQALKNVDATVNKELDRLASIEEDYERLAASSTPAELSKFADAVFPKAVKQMSADEKHKLSYATEYELFHSHVERNVMIGRRRVESFFTTHEEEWGVVKGGLDKNQLTYIFATFGGGKYYDFNKAHKLLLTGFKASFTGQFLTGLKAGWELKQMKLKPITNVLDLATHWGAKRRECTSFVGTPLLVMSCEDL